MVTIFASRLRKTNANVCFGIQVLWDDGLWYYLSAEGHGDKKAAVRGTKEQMNMLMDVLKHRKRKYKRVRF